MKTFGLSWRTRHYGVWSHLLSGSGGEPRHFKAREDKEKSRLSKDLKKERRVSQWARLLYGDFSPSFLFFLYPKRDNLKRCSDCIFNAHVATAAAAVFEPARPRGAVTLRLSWAFCAIVAEMCMSNKLFLLWGGAVLQGAEIVNNLKKIVILLTVTLEDIQAW